MLLPDAVFRISVTLGLKSKLESFLRKGELNCTQKASGHQLPDELVPSYNVCVFQYPCGWPGAQETQDEKYGPRLPVHIQ